jgi:hypothetical protein
MREIVSGKGSRFLLCQLTRDDARFPKYPPQPIVRCEGYEEREGAGHRTSSPGAGTGKQGNERKG